MRFKKTIAFAVSLAFLATSAMPLSVRNVLGTEIAMSVSADEAAEQNKCGENAVWTLEDGQLTFSGNGAIDDYEADNAPWDKTKVTSVVIENGITAIGSHAFSGIVLGEVNIPSTVVSLGEYAFSECNAKINLAAVPIQIGNNAFAGDTVNYGELEEFDYTLADFIGGQNVTSSDEDIKDMDISLSRYDGKDAAEYGINAGDTLKINVNWNDYTPSGKVFYTTNVGYMLYMPDTYNYSQGMQKYFSVNPYFFTAGTAKSVNVNVYEVTGVNTLTRICTKTFTLDSQANNETFKKSLEGISTVMFAGQTKTIAQILAEMGIGHVKNCLNISNAKAAEGENLTVDILNSQITADEVGTAVVSYNASISGCAYHGNASASGNMLTVYVTQMPEITATETSVTIADVEGYEFYLNGTTAGEKVSGGTTFTGLEPGRTYTMFMKKTDGMGQTSFTVSPSGHKLAVSADKADKSTANFTCLNEDCVNSEEISAYFVKLAVSNDGGCEANVEIQQSEGLEGVEISNITYFDEDGNEVSESELAADTYTAKSVVNDGENEVTVEADITFGAHSFTEGVCDICKANETVIVNNGFATEYTYGDEIKEPAKKDFTTNGDADKMTFTWFDSKGNVLEAAPVNAGSYKLMVSMPAHTYKDKVYTSENLTLEITVKKATELTTDDFTVTVPEELIYNGEAKSVEVTANTEGLGEISVKYYDAEGNEAEPINAGTYSFAVNVAQGDNNEEIIGVTGESWTFEIEKLSTLSADDFTVELPSEAVYDGEAKTAVVTPLVDGVGEITVKYIDTNGEAAEPIAKGTYKISIDVAEGVNNKAVTDITNDKWVFFISKAPAYVVTPPKAVEGLVYDGEEHTLIEAGEAVGGTLLYSTTKSGVYSEELPKTISGGTYTIWYYVKGDGINYSDSEKLSIEVNVARIPAILSTPPQPVESLVYTGSSLKLVTAGQSDTGTLMYSLTQGAGYSSKIPTAIQAGTYTVWYYVQGDSPNYSDTEIASVEVTISLAEAIVRSTPVPKTNLVYDGTAQALVASGKAKGGNMVYSLSEDGNFLMVIPTAKDAGTYKVWYYVQSTDKNYVDSQKAYVEVIIAKVPNEIKTAPTAIEGLVYNGEAQTLITADATAKYGTMMYALSEDGEYSAEIPAVTDAGTYQVWYYAQGNDNYADTEKAYVEVTVGKAEGSVGAPPAAIENLTYNGEAQAIVSAGKTNTGTMMYSLSQDGEYSSEIPTVTNAGTYTVWYYSLGDTNHYDSAKASIEASMKKAAVTVEVMPSAAEGLVYNGEAQALITAGEAVNGTMLYALSEEGEYSSEIPSATNAGTYTVWYYVKGDENYADTKPASIEITIEKLASVVNPFIEDKEYSEGDALPEISLSEGDTKGTVSWVIQDILLQVGENVLEWFFTPEDENYSTVTGTAVVNAKETTTSTSVTVSDTTADSSTTSDTTASSSTTSDTTASSSTTSDTTASSSTTSDTTASSSTTSDTTASSSTTSDTTASSSTTSDTTASSSTTSDTTASSSTTSDTTASSSTTSDTTASSSTTSDTTASSSTTSDTTASSSTTSAKVTTTAVTTTPTVETKIVYIGDANQDDKVNVRDAALIAYMLSIDYADALPFTADFNQDGVTNVRDAAAIARALASNEAKHWIQVIIKVYPKQ